MVVNGRTYNDSSSRDEEERHFRDTYCSLRVHPLNPGVRLTVNRLFLLEIPRLDYLQFLGENIEGFCGLLIYEVQDTSFLPLDLTCGSDTELRLRVDQAQLALEVDDWTLSNPEDPELGLDGSLKCFVV